MARLRAMILIGETGQLTFFGEVAKRLSLHDINVSLCCDRDDSGVAEAIKCFADANEISYFVLRENYSIEELFPRNCSYFDFLPLIEKLQLGIILKVLDFMFKSLRRNIEYAKRLLFDDYLDIKFKTEVDYFRALHRKKVSEATELFTTEKTDIIVVGEDGIASNLWAITAAKALGVGVVVVPFGIANSQLLIKKGLEEKFAHNELYSISSQGGKKLFKNYPHWFTESKFGLVLYFKPSFIFSLEEEKISIDNPWCMQGGSADKIFLDGEYSQSQFLEDGVPRSKMTVTGSIYADIIYDLIASNENYLSAYKNNSKIYKNKSRIVVFLPPQEVDYWYCGKEFSSIVEYAYWLENELGNISDVELKFSLHPRMALEVRNEVSKVVSNISTQTAFELIVQNDFFIMNHSSLSRWAILAGKPVLNYDIYQLDLNYFPSCSGYFYAKRKAQLIKRALDLIEHENTYSRMSAGCQSKAVEISLMDGKSALRISQKLKELFPGKNTKSEFQAF